jgi:NAD+ synthase
MDLALYALNHGYSAAELGVALKLSEHQAQQVFNDILAKRKATRYMHLKPQLVEPVKELNLP